MWNAFLDRPSILPGGAALVAALQTPGRLGTGGVLEYGLGLEIDRDKARRRIAHSGSTAGYKAWLGRYPDQKVSVALMCNNGDVDPVSLGEAIAHQALLSAGYAPAQAVAPAGPRAVVSLKDAARYQGLFRNPVSGELIRLTAADRQLTLTRGGSQTLKPLGENRFETANGGVLMFHRQGGAPDLSLTMAGVTQDFIAVRPADTAPLADYVGRYYSAELETQITVSQQGEGLVMRQPFAVEWRLSPSFADAFTTRLRGVTTFVFARNADGQVTAFGAWAGGARNVVFVKQ